MTVSPPRADRLGADPGQLASRPRVDLVVGPTPLQPAPLLSRELGVPVLFKRDDLTGRGLGGNKLRGLEYILADALGQGCDCMVTGAGPQSNWTMLAALSCLRYQLEPHIVCYGTGAVGEGNMRLHRWLGVDVRFTGETGRPRWTRASKRSGQSCGPRAVARTWSRAAGRRRSARSATSARAPSWPLSWPRWARGRLGCGWPQARAEPRLVCWPVRR